MSLERDVMQFILDLLRDGIVKASANHQIGRTPFDKIDESKLPLVQVFAPIVEGTAETAQRPGTMTFQLEIIDKIGRKEDLRRALEALDSTLRIDSSFHGLIRKGIIEARGVAELGEDKKTIASATIVCQLYEAVIEPPFTEVLDFRDSSKFILTNCAVEDSMIIGQSMGVRRVTPGTGSIVIEGSVNSGALPSPGGITLNKIERIRTALYLTPEYGPEMDNLSLQLYVDNNLSNGGWFNPVTESFIGSNGWQYQIHSIQAAPDVTFGTGLGDRSVIRAIRFVWNMLFNASFSSTRFGLVLFKFGYTERDTGRNADADYHSDLIATG